MNVLISLASEIILEGIELLFAQKMELLWKEHTLNCQHQASQTQDPRAASGPQ